MFDWHDVSGRKELMKKMRSIWWSLVVSLVSATLVSICHFLSP